MEQEYPSSDKQVRDRLIKYITAEKPKRSSIAERTKLTENTISSFISGKGKPHYLTVYRLHDYLNSVGATE